MVHFQCVSRDILSKVFCHLLTPFMPQVIVSCLHTVGHSVVGASLAFQSVGDFQSFNDWGLFGLSFRWISSEFNFLRTQRYCPLIGSDTPLWHARGQSEVSVLCVYVCSRGGVCGGSLREFGFRQQKLKCWGVKVLEVLPEALLKSGMFLCHLLFTKLQIVLMIWLMKNLRKFCLVQQALN